MTESASVADRGHIFPLFMVGVAIAVAAETAIGMLIYTTPGLLGALTVVLGVQIAALAAGVASQPAEVGRGGRWRWFLATGAFGIAGAASVAWVLDTDFMATWTTRGLSLAVLAALPMYGCGLLLSAVPRPEEGRGHAVPVLLGALTGVVLVGLVLFDRLQPFGIWLFGIFCISAAAFVTAGQVAMEMRDEMLARREEEQRVAYLERMAAAAEAPMEELQR